MKIGFECQGVFWHNELYKKKYTHQEKYLKCKAININLIQTWQDDWLYKNDIVKSYIKKILLKNIKIESDNMSIRTINDDEASHFIENNDITNFNRKVSLFFGLFKDDILYATMAETKRRRIFYKIYNIAKLSCYRW